MRVKEEREAKAKAEKEKKKQAEEEMKNTPPEEYFKKYESKEYSQFDERGVPTHNAEGKELSET